MKPNAFLSIMCAAVLLVSISSCGSETDSAAAGSTAVTVQPPEGVPAATEPLPLPEVGQAYNNPQPRENVQDGGTVTFPIDELGPNFNGMSIDGNSAYVARIMNWLAPRLWNYSVTGLVEPNTDYLLSAELISEDPETVRYTLNPEARWNDGTPLDWTAFDATWRAQSGNDARFNPASTEGYRSIASVAKGAADNEVIVTFAEPFYPFEALFSDLLHPRNIDPEFYRTGWVNEIHNDLLAGPFIVASLSETRLELARNPAWWSDSAKLERVVYIQMEDQASINAFQNGEVDATTVMTADRRRQIQNMDDVQIRRGFDTRTAVYTMGRDSAFFSSDVARRAFVLGTDRRLLVEIRFQGMNWQEEPPGSVLLYPWQDGYQDNLGDLHYDPEEAARILDAAGWTMGSDGYRYKDGQVASFRFVTFGDDPLYAALARAQQRMSRDIGLRMEIDTRKSADFSRVLTSGDFDVVMMAWSASDPFGYVFLCQLFCSDSESNYSGIGTAAIDELLRVPGQTPERDQAIAAANTAEGEALQLIGTYPLFNGPRAYAVKAGLANYGPAGYATDRFIAKNIGWQKTAPD